MQRRQFVKLGMLGALLANVRSALGKSQTAVLVTVDIPSPKTLRGGWAALAAVMAARGWGQEVYASERQWHYHDGGGNWASLRFKAKDQIVLLGHDHEYSDTYYGAAAQYFDEPETDLLRGAPVWWGFDLDPLPFDWIGFVYGWDGARWQRAQYDKDDGFTGVNLLRACSINELDLLREFCLDAPGLNGQPPSDEALKALVAADANLSREMLEAVIPGWDLDAGIAAAAKFLQARI